MFSIAASKYWNLYCHVGSTNGTAPARVHGLGCRIGPGFVLTAVHVYQQYQSPTVLLTNGLWECAVVQEWEQLDISLIRVTKQLKANGKGEEPEVYPSLASRIPSLGASLGYIGWLNLLDESGKHRGRTCFGQAHVAFFEKGLKGQTLLAIAGSAVQQGFSGVPVFEADGTLSGVLVEALQYVPELHHPVQQVNSLPLVSPIARIRDDLLRCMQDT
jgi:hypothetical protein